MIHKRHLLTAGTDSGLESTSDNEKNTKTFAMGEDEQWEAASKNTLTPRTWWSMRTKIK